MPRGLFAIGVAGVLAASSGASAAAAYNIPPVQGKLAVSSNVAGHVTVRRPGSKTFVELAPGEIVPNGSKINATHGTVVLVVRQHGKLREVSISGGEFIFTQNPHTGRVVFKLSPALTGCLEASASGAARAVTSTVHKRRPRRRRGPRRRQITVSDSGGNFGTTGQYVATSTEGTRWRTADACGSSTVTVFSGRVRVKNLRTGRVITLTAGQHYSAHAHR